MTQKLLTPLLMAMLLLSGGCESIRYYSQAVGGQLSLLAAREDISDILDNIAVDGSDQSDVTPRASKEQPAGFVTDETAERLRDILQMRTFAANMLALPVGKTFSSYVDLQASSPQDNYVVWNVFAAPELSVEAKFWCYPIAGCAQYRGYFNKQQALAYASQLEEQGFDTYVAGVRAYSTLGWFADPVLSSFLGYSESALAGLIFHELAHKVAYVGGDTEFNESFATVVEREGLKQWLLSQNKPKQLKEYEQGKQVHADFVALIVRLREQLSDSYQSAQNDEQKRQSKTALFGRMQKDFEKIVQSQPTASRYSGWMKQLDNNAKLVPINSYNRWVPALTNLFESVNNDFALFYKRIEWLADQSDSQRESNLQQLEALTVAIKPASSTLSKP